MLGRGSWWRGAYRRAHILGIVQRQIKTGFFVRRLMIDRSCPWNRGRSYKGCKMPLRVRGGFCQPVKALPGDTGCLLRAHVGRIRPKTLAAGKLHRLHRLHHWRIEEVSCLLRADRDHCIVYSFISSWQLCLFAGPGTREINLKRNLPPKSSFPKLSFIAPVVQIPRI